MNDISNTIKTRSIRKRKPAKKFVTISEGSSQESDEEL